MTTRKTPIVLGLVAVMLFATVVALPAVLADGSSHGTEAKSKRDAHRDLNETKRSERRENVSAAFDAFHDAIAAARASWHENKTAVLEACRAEKNATADNEAEHCVRDGLKPLHEQARMDIRAALASLKAALKNLWPWSHHGHDAA